MATRKERHKSLSNKTDRHGFELKNLVWTIGYQLTAYIGRTNGLAVRDWLKNGLPEHLEERMQAALDVSRPIAQAESELVAQYFLIRRRIVFVQPSTRLTAGHVG